MNSFSLIEAVYSDKLTGSHTSQSEQNLQRTSQSQTSTAQYIERIPYFTLVKRVFTERDETAEILSQQLETVKKK